MSLVSLTNLQRLLMVENLLGYLLTFHLAAKGIILVRFHIQEIKFLDQNDSG